MIICIIIFFIQHNLNYDLVKNSYYYFNQSNQDDFFNKTFALHSVSSEYFNNFQLVSYAFLHADISHILLNLLGLWIFGTRLEKIFGAKKFIQFTLISAVGAAVVHLIYFYFFGLYYSVYIDKHIYRDIISAPTMGLSGVIYACMAAFAYLLSTKDNNFISPIQLRWLILIIIGYEVINDLLIKYYIEDNGYILIAYSNIEHFANLGGAAIGLIWAYFQHKNNYNKNQSE